MSAVAEFLRMGGYAPFVWSAYGIWAAVMLWIIVSARARHRSVTRRVMSRLRAEDMKP
jgi:heme exporter protein D